MALLSKVVGLSLLLGGAALELQASSRHIPGLQPQTKDHRADGIDGMVRDAGSQISDAFKNIGKNVGNEIKETFTDNAVTKAIEKVKAKGTEKSKEIGKKAEQQFKKAMDSPLGKKIQGHHHTDAQAKPAPLLNAQKKVEGDRATGGWTHFDDVNPWEGDVGLKKAERKVVEVKEGPNDAMIDHMWSMKHPTDNQIQQTWSDMIKLAKTPDERKLIAKELNAWISMIMGRREKELAWHQAHPLGDNVVSFYKEGRLVTTADQAVDMASDLEGLPSSMNLAHLPADDMVEALWQLQNPTNAQIKEAWRTLMAPTQTEDEKLLVSKEVKEWIKYVMNRRAAALYRNHA